MWTANNKFSVSPTEDKLAKLAEVIDTSVNWGRLVIRARPQVAVYVS